MDTNTDLVEKFFDQLFSEYKLEVERELKEQLNEVFWFIKNKYKQRLSLGARNINIHEFEGKDGVYDQVGARLQALFILGYLLEQHLPYGCWYCADFDELAILLEHNHDLIARCTNTCINVNPKIAFERLKDFEKRYFLNDD